MTDPDFGALAGRIEGLARAFLVLGASLQRQGVLDEQQLQARLRIHAEELEPEQPLLQIAAQTLNELADQLLADHRHAQGASSPRQ